MRSSFANFSLRPKFCLRPKFRPNLTRFPQFDLRPNSRPKFILDFHLRPHFGLDFGLSNTKVKLNLAAVSWEFPVLKEYNLVLSPLGLGFGLRPNRGQVRSELKRSKNYNILFTVAWIVLWTTRFWHSRATSMTGEEDLLCKIDEFFFQVCKCCKDFCTEIITNSRLKHISHVMTTVNCWSWP